MTTADWTDETVEWMTTLWLEGASAAAIARKLGAGVTRSAVLGKIHRLGVRRLPATAPRRSAAAAGRRTRLKPCSAPRSSIAGALTVPPAAPVEPLATLLSVRRGCCRWPCGEPGSADLPVCGRPVSRGAYCLGHARVGYRDRGSITLLALAGLSEG